MKALLNRDLDVDAVEAWAGTHQAQALMWFEAGREDRHLPTAIARWFKNQRMGRTGNRALGGLADALAGQLTPIVLRFRPTHISRVLASWETTPSEDAPLDVLARCLAEKTGVPVTRPARRTTSRPPMSLRPRLSGREALRQRIQYAGQDLVFEGDLAGMRVCVLDDIRCLGASGAVWGWACTALLGAEDAAAVNLAQISGLDRSCGVMEVDPEALRLAAVAAAGREGAMFGRGWRSDGIVHTRRSCDSIRDSAAPWWNGLLVGNLQKCSLCGNGGWRGAPLSVLLRRLFTRF